MHNNNVKIIIYTALAITLLSIMGFSFVIWYGIAWRHMLESKCLAYPTFSEITQEYQSRGLKYFEEQKSKYDNIVAVDIQNIQSVDIGCPTRYSFRIIYSNNDVSIGEIYPYRDWKYFVILNYSKAEYELDQRTLDLQ